MEKAQKFIEAVLRWDYGRDFFRAWVLAPKLPLYVSVVLFKAGVDNGIVHVECLPCKCTEDEMALLSRIGGLNPSGVLILLDLYGKDVMTRGVVRQLIQGGGWTFCRCFAFGIRAHFRRLRNLMNWRNI